MGKSSTDFKRLKAKVGKKVAKAPNDTDTTFRKASLFIADQSIKTNSTETVLSQKGKSMPDLLLQFGHHAGTARNSALKGLISIMKENETMAIQSLLHGLVQVASKAMVDDEPTVRKTAFLLLNELTTRFEKFTLVPFMPLMIAYTSSAMHSLDRDMRFDGANAVGVVASFFGPTMREYVVSLLPPFVNLLSDREKLKDIGRLLDALVSLLSTLDLGKDGPSSEQCQAREDDQNQPYFCFRASSRSRNAFLQRNRRVAQRFEKHCCLPLILGAHKHLAVDDHEHVHQPTTVRIPSRLLHEIQLKLCDLLDETAHEETEKCAYAQKSKLSFEDMKVLMQAIQMVYEVRLATRFHENDSVDSCQLRMANLLVDLFHTNFNRSACVSVHGTDDYMNLSITQTLLTVACFPSNTHASKGWIEKLLAVWLPFFENKVGNGLTVIEVQVIQQILQALSKIPRMASQSSRDRLYEQLCKKFFNDPDLIIARSLAGRNAATLLASRYVDEVKKFGPLVLQNHVFTAFIKALPLYLKAWSLDFERESSVVLDALRSCVIYGDDSTPHLLRDNVFAILDADVSGASRLPSLFERYSVNLQRKFLDLIQSIENPSPHVLKALAASCMWSKHVSDDVVLRMEDEIVVTITSIRKTIPMTNYVSFLVGTMGVPRVGTELSTNIDEGALERFLQSLDRRVSRGGKAIIECGSHNCLRMVTPQLLTWMEVPDKEDASLKTLLRNRGSMSLLAMLLVDLKKANTQVTGLMAVLGIFEQCCKVSSNLVSFLAKSVGLSEHLRDQLLSPLATLMEMDLQFALRLKTHFPDVMQEIGHVATKR